MYNMIMTMRIILVFRSIYVDIRFSSIRDGVRFRWEGTVQLSPSHLCEITASNIPLSSLKVGEYQREVRVYGGVRWSVIGDIHIPQFRRDRFVWARPLLSLVTRDLPGKRRLLLGLAVSGSLCVCVCVCSQPICRVLCVGATI